MEKQPQSQPMRAPLTWRGNEELKLGDVRSPARARFTTATTGCWSSFDISSQGGIFSAHPAWNLQLERPVEERPMWHHWRAAVEGDFGCLEMYQSQSSAIIPLCLAYWHQLLPNKCFFLWNILVNFPPRVLLYKRITHKACIYTKMTTLTFIQVFSVWCVSRIERARKPAFCTAVR